MSDILGTTAQKVMQDIQRLVAQGEFGEEGRLPPERNLAERFGVARNTLRQALTKMEKEGLLLRQVGRGTFVKARPANGEEQPWTLRDASPTEIMEVRLIMEPHAAALAATRASSSELSRLKLALDKSLKAEETREFENWDAEIHLGIFEATKNAVLLHYCREINVIRKQPAWFELKKRSLSPERRRLYNRQHRALVGAILARNPDEAYRLAREHALEVKVNLVGE